MPESFQAAVERRLKQAETPPTEMRYGYVVDHPEVKKNLDAYFRKNKHVAGMVVGGGHNGSSPDEPVSIVVNEHNKNMADKNKREGLIKIEAARAIMADNPINDFPITDNLQRLRKQHFKPDEPYYFDDLAFKESLVSRVMANDIPDKLVTPEMRAEAMRYEKLLKLRENQK